MKKMIAKNDRTQSRKYLEYLEIVDWGDHLHPDLTRKVKPPFRWIKLQTENLDILGDLTLKEYGAYCRLLNLAALTNNCVVFNPNALKRRTGITQKDVEKLQIRNLIRITNENQVSEKTLEKQSNDSETASGSQAESPQAAALEGRGGDKNRSDLRGLEEGLSPDDLDIDAPPRPRSTREKESLDPRSFEEIKALVLPIALRFNTKDPDMILRYGAQSLKVSPKQCQTAVKQLIEDKQL